jgi:GNAT superfamily N-acetyltransferase
MKPESRCPSRWCSFDSIAGARDFACSLGVAPEFFTPDGVAREVGPVQLYVDERGGMAAALLVFHEASREVGLWVHPDFRRVGLGGRTFKAAACSGDSIPWSHRIFARVDSAYVDDAAAMRAILLRNGFDLISGPGAVELWCRAPLDHGWTPPRRSRGEGDAVRLSMTILIGHAGACFSTAWR